MQLGDPDTGEERTERSRLDVVLDKLKDDFGELLDTIESGGLDQLNAAEKISWWQEFEAFGTGYHSSITVWSLMRKQPISPVSAPSPTSPGS